MGFSFLFLYDFVGCLVGLYVSFLERNFWNLYVYVSCYYEVVGSYRGEGRRVFMDFHFFSFGGQFRVFGDSVCA